MYIYINIYTKICQTKTLCFFFFCNIVATHIHTGCTFSFIYIYIYIYTYIYIYIYIYIYGIHFELRFFDSI